VHGRQLHSFVIFFSTEEKALAFSTMLRDEKVDVLRYKPAMVIVESHPWPGTDGTIMNSVNHCFFFH